MFFAIIRNPLDNAEYFTNDSEVYGRKVSNWGTVPKLFLDKKKAGKKAKEVGGQVIGLRPTAV